MIYCANCEHCIQSVTRLPKRKIDVYRSKCRKKHWGLIDGKEKTIMQHDLLDKLLISCPHYESMGSHEDALSSLPLTKEDCIVYYGESDNEEEDSYGC